MRFKLIQPPFKFTMRWAAPLFWPSSPTLPPPPFIPSSFLSLLLSPVILFFLLLLLFFSLWHTYFLLPTNPLLFLILSSVIFFSSILFLDYYSFVTYPLPTLSVFNFSLFSPSSVMTTSSTVSVVFRPLPSNLLFFFIPSFSQFLPVDYYSANTQQKPDWDKFISIYIDSNWVQLNSHQSILFQYISMI